MVYKTNSTVILFPAFGGTLTESDAKMEPTQYTPTQLSLPLLRPVDIKEIMSDVDLSKLYEGAYREFWNAIGIVPRHLQWTVGYNVTELQSIAVNDDTVKSTFYTNVASIVKKQYCNYLQDSCMGELAMRTISGLKKYNTDERIIKYIKEGNIYCDDNGFIGIPLVVIDVLSTTMDFIPKNVVSDFIMVSNKPLWERFEELCLKTMTARFNVLFSISNSKEVEFSKLFQGAHFKSSLDSISLETRNSSWFEYSCLDEKILGDVDHNEKVISHKRLKKVKKNQDDVDGLCCSLFNSSRKRMVFVTQNKFQNEESQKGTLEPADIVKYYQKAVKTPFKDSETFVIIFTNKKITNNTMEMLSIRLVVIHGSRR